MKKIFMTLVMVGFVLTAQASFSLTWNYEDENEETIEVAITQDTTIVVSDYEKDFFAGGMVMSIEGNLNIDATPADFTVRIAREAAGLRDEFCLGNCVGGNGEKNQEIVTSLLSTNNTWYTHFYPTEPGINVIAYTFVDGDKSITITVKYCYQMDDTAVEAVATPSYIKGIYNLLGQKMPTDNINELPAGIYVVNGKKIIKQ